MMPMPVTTMLDYGIGILLIVSVIIGYHRGLVLTIARVIALAVSYVGAGMTANILKGSVGHLIASSLLEKQTADSMLGALAQPALEAAAEGIAYSVLFFIAFFVLELVLMHLVNVLKVVDHIPVVGKINKLGGAVVGFFWVFLILLLLGNVFFTYIPKEVQHQMGFTRKAVKETVLLNVFVP